MTIVVSQAALAMLGIFFAIVTAAGLVFSVGSLLQGAFSTDDRPALVILAVILAGHLVWLLLIISLLGN